MTLGKNKAVSVIPFGIVRIDIHFSVVDGYDRICAGERSARMAALCLVNHRQNVYAAIDGDLFEFFHSFLHFLTPFPSFVLQRPLSVQNT